VAETESTEAETAGDAATPAKRKVDIVKVIRKLVSDANMCQRTILLPPLDMDVLPASSNLLAAMLVRLEDRIPSNRPRLSQISVWCDEERTGRKDSFSVLKVLLSDAAIALDGNMEGRKSGLEPDVFAEEQLRTERIRLGFADRLGDALEMIATSRQTNDGRPLFLLPIDDFDLNPPRCLELLERLHAFRSPYILFLILGDVDLAESILDLQFFNKFGQAAGEGKAFVSSRTEEIQSRVRELSSQARRKIIPPEQVVRLEPWTLDEALAFTPKESDPILEKVLNNIAMPLSDLAGTHRSLFKENQIETLGTLLLPPSDKAGSSSGNRYIYQAVNIFRTTPRILADLYQAFSAFSPKKVNTPDEENRRQHLKEFLALVFAFCKSSINESILSEDTRKKYLSAISTDNYGQPSFYDAYLSTSFQGDKNIDFFLENSRMRVSECSGWSIHLKKEEGQESLPGTPLEPYSAAWLALFHDLLSIVQDQSTDLRLSSNLFDGLISCIYGAEEGKLFVIFPSPPLLSFFECDIFRVRWNSIFNRIQEQQKEIKSYQLQLRIVFGWILASVSTLDCTRKFTVGELNDEDIIIKEKIISTIKYIWNRTRKENDPVTKDYFVTFLSRILVCLLPEFGCIGKFFDEIRANVNESIFKSGCYESNSIKSFIIFRKEKIRNSLLSIGFADFVETISSIQFPGVQHDSK